VMTKPTKTKSNSDMTTITRAATNRVIFAALLSVLASALLLGGCSPCIDEVIWRKPSPDSKLTVTVFLRDCGATTKPVSWVTVHPSSGRYDNEKDIALTADRVQKIEVTWTDNSNVSIRCLTCQRSEVHAQRMKVAWVNVHYQFDLER